MYAAALSSVLRADLLEAEAEAAEAAELADSDDEDSD